MSNCKKKNSKEEINIKDIFCSQEYEQKVENQKALADEKDKEFYNLANEKDFERFEKLNQKIDKAAKEYNSPEAKEARQKQFEDMAKEMENKKGLFTDDINEYWLPPDNFVEREYKELSTDPEEQYKQIVREILKNNSASISLIQRVFGIGFARAARFVDKMEEDGLISVCDGCNPRKILITEEDFFKMFNEKL
ncbi:MAG: hypothetical protein IJW32_05145 [Clostridia bacterium]|nr:hypothetical protein [Clostridia bacterium]